MVTATSMLTVKIFQAVTTVAVYLDTLEMDLTAQVCYHACDKQTNNKRYNDTTRFDIASK